MADNNQYKISLGVNVDTSDITSQIRGIRPTERIDIGINLDTRDVQNQINNIRRQIQDLGNIRINLGGNNGNGGNGRNAVRGIDDVTRAYRELISLQNRIGSKQQSVARLDTSKNQREIIELSSQIDNLYGRYQRLYNLFSTDFSVAQLDNLNRNFQITSENLDYINKKVADTKNELANSIQLKLNNGSFSNDISKINNDFDKLTNKTSEIRIAMNRFNQAIRDMNIASEIGDVQELIDANERYEQALKNVQNQLRINAREEKADIASQKLTDDIFIFQSKVDAWMTKNSAATKQFGDRLRQLKIDAQNCDRVTLNHLEKELKQIDKEAEAAGVKMQTFGDRLKTQFSKYSSYFSVASLFIYGTQALRSMFDQVVAIDSAMTELKKVTDETDASYNKFLGDTSSRAKELGTTIDGLVSSTADFARLGYGFKESQGLAEVANIYAVVGDDIKDVETATQSLISTLTAFKDEANGLSDSDFAMSIVDKMNEVSNNFAISSGGLGDALQRSASSMMAANNSLDETIALITAANTVVQDPDAVGRLMPTLKMAISVKLQRWTRPRKDFISIFDICQLGRAYIFCVQFFNKEGDILPAKGQLSGYFIKCEYCGKEIYQTKTQYNRAKHHFCSNQCQKAFQHNELFEDRKCEICENIFHVSKKSTQKFCSTKCQAKWQSMQVGILNPRSTKVEIKCEYCGNKFFEKLYKTKNGQHNFCSNKCRQDWYSNIFSQDDEWKEESRKRAVRILENKEIDTNTKPQQIINNMLTNMNISYVNEKGFEFYAVDNYLDKHGLIIEVMGDFWHCHPLKYNKDNIRDIHKKRIPKDKAKHTYFKNNYNIEILYLWENDIYNNSDVCKALINKYINNNGILDNYHSFNYRLANGSLVLNDNIIVPYQDMVNA